MKCLSEGLIDEYVEALKAFSFEFPFIDEHCLK